MANVSLRSTSQVWMNNDGLSVFFGPAEGATTKVGEYIWGAGNTHYVEAVIVLANLPTVASSNKQILSDTVTIPNGALIEKVSVLCTKETAGVNANLNVGLVDQDRTTEIDYDGFLAAADAFNGGTDLGVVTDYVVGTTEAGALIGTKVTNTGFIVAWADTADFTAGVVAVRIYYTLPLSADV